jgi:hypothetical protein
LERAFRQIFNALYNECVSDSVHSKLRDLRSSYTDPDPSNRFDPDKAIRVDNMQSISMNNHDAKLLAPEWTAAPDRLDHCIPYCRTFHHGAFVERICVRGCPSDARKLEAPWAHRIVSNKRSIAGVSIRLGCDYSCGPGHIYFFNRVGCIIMIVLVLCINGMGVLRDVLEICCW